MKYSIILGSFNAEKTWKHKGMSKLPAFNDRESDNIIKVLDEIQFLFCLNKEDILISGYSLDPEHKNYLHELGFLFDNIGISENLGASTDILESNKCICRLLSESDNSAY